MKKSVGLLRISTELQTEKNGGTSLQIQHEKISQYIKLNDFEMVGMFEDVCSGGLETRDGIEKVIKLIKSKSVDVVLIYKVDRLFRSMLGFSKFYQLIKKYDVELISVCEGLSSKNETSSLVFNLMMSVGEFEKSTIKNRLSSGRHFKSKMGVRGFGGRVPFGYVRNINGDVIVDVENSKIVSYIYKKVNQLKSSTMTKTKKTQHLLKLLAEKKYTFRGKKFDTFKVRQILSNPFYMGTLKYGSTISKGIHEPIISKRLYGMVHYGN
jgi:site-specific DNA recombinase